MRIDGIMKFSKYIFITATFLGCALNDEVKPEPPAPPTVEVGVDGVKHTLVPFVMIDEIIPGHSKLMDAIRAKGDPVQIKQIQKNGSYENKIVRFKDGITVVIDHSNVQETNPVIDAIYAEHPYPGVSSHGLKIGMSRVEALVILEENFYRSNQFGESFIYAVDPSGDDDLQVFFAQKKLIRIKLYK